MATLETRITNAETRITALEADLTSFVRVLDISNVEALRDQENESQRQSITEIQKQLDRLKRDASILRAESLQKKTPRISAISGGALVYTVTHKLGYKPQVQVINSSGVLLDSASAAVNHVNNSKFTVTVLSTTLEGSILYL